MAQGYSVVPNMSSNKPKGHHKLGAVLKLLEKALVLLVSHSMQALCDTDTSCTDIAEVF